jgi:hypothetical protein
MVSGRSLLSQKYNSSRIRDPEKLHPGSGSQIQGVKMPRIPDLGSAILVKMFYQNAFSTCCNNKKKNNKFRAHLLSLVSSLIKAKSKLNDRRRRISKTHYIP